MLARITVPQFPDVRPNPNVAQSSFPSWSPDGQFVLAIWYVDAVYVSAAQVGPGGLDSWSYPGDIYAVSRDGQWRVRLTSWKWADVQADTR